MHSYNSAPSFLTVPADQSFSSGHTLIYNMPVISDPENDPIVVSVATTCLYAALITQGPSPVLTMNPLITDIGTCTVTINLFDGINNAASIINIVTVNSPPSFISSPTNQAFSSGHIFSFTILSTTDPDGDLVTVATTTVCTYPVVLNLNILTLSPLIANIGTCTLTLTLSDGLNLTPYTINIVTSNSPPYFSPSLSPGVSINAGLSNTYTLPSMLDIDLDIVTMTYS